MTVSIFYPSLDGYAGHSETEQAWTDIVQGEGNTFDYDDEYSQMVDIWAYTIEPTWRFNTRGILLFDTSGIPVEDEIISAKLRLYGVYKLDNLGCEPDMAVYASNPASTEALTGTDYSTLGTIPLSAILPWASWVVDDWIELIFNDAGLAAISRTGLTKLGIRNANYDVAEELDPGHHAPPWVSNADAYFYAYMVEKGAPYRPELVVEHAPAAVGRSRGYVVG